MAAPSLSSAIQVGADVLRTVRSKVTGAILAQLGSVTGSTADSDEVEWWQHVGFLSRPPRADANVAAAQVVVLKRGDHDVAIASKDLRGLKLAGELEDGETCIYAPGVDGEGQARILLKANGSISLFTTAGNAPDGEGITVSLNADGSFVVLSSQGGIAIAENKITLLNPAGSGIEMSKDGTAVLGSSITLGGGLNPPSGVMTYYTAIGGIVPTLTSFAAAASSLAAAMTPIITASTALPGEKATASAAFTTLATRATELTAAFSNPLESYSKVVAATE